MTLAVAESLSLVLFILNRGPGLIRIEEFHLLEFVERPGPEVLLIDNAIVADDEGLYSGDTILGRRGDQGEAPDHHAFDHIVEPAQRSIRTLPLENLEIVAVIRLFLA